MVHRNISLQGCYIRFSWDEIFSIQLAESIPFKEKVLGREPLLEHLLIAHIIVIDKIHFYWSISRAMLYFEIDILCITINLIITSSHSWTCFYVSSTVLSDLYTSILKLILNIEIKNFLILRRSISVLLNIALFNSLVSIIVSRSQPVALTKSIITYINCLLSYSHLPRFPTYTETLL